MGIWYNGIISHLQCDDDSSILSISTISGHNVKVAFRAWDSTEAVRFSLPRQSNGRLV